MSELVSTRGSAGPVAVDRIEDTAAFERLSDGWNELLRSSDSDCLFLTWEWLYTWWKHHSAGRELYIIAVRFGRELAAIAPLCLRRRRLERLQPLPSLEFLGTGSVGSDYLDLIARRGRAAQALEALAEHLDGKRLLIELAQLRRKACLASELAGRLERRGWSFSEEKINTCPFIDLSGHSWESYLARLGPEHRYNFQRRLKNLAKQFEVSFELVSSEEERRKTLAELIALHNQRWRGSSNAFNRAGLIAFHEELSCLALARGWLRLVVLRLNGKAAACLYGFRYGNSFYFYQSGYDPNYGKHSVGLVIMGLAIKIAIEEGALEYDLLHGDEEYKFRWARAARELSRIVLYPPGSRGLFYRETLRLGRAARKMARRVLPKNLTARITATREICF